MKNSGKSKYKNPRRRAQELEKLVGKNIQKYRLKKGITQRELASSLGLTFQQIQKYENATNRISAGRLMLLSEYLGVPMMALFEGKETLALSETQLRNLSEGAIRIAKAYDQTDKPQIKKAIFTILEEVKIT